MMGDREMAAYLHIIANIYRRAQIDPPISDADQFVHHGLICPLTQQRSDRIIPPIENQQYRLGDSHAEIPQVWIIPDMIDQLLT